jgi:uncharacterized protein YndB with AHSA1/START domain
MKNEPVIIERTFNAPVEKVWKALTDISQMKKWYFDMAEFKPVVGFEFTFEGGNKEENKIFIHLCKITAVEPLRKLAYTWKYKGYSGESLVTIELFGGGKTTRLKLTHEGLETFPTDTKDFAKENFVMGWNHIIGTSLKDYFEN